MIMSIDYTSAFPGMNVLRTLTIPGQIVIGQLECPVGPLMAGGNVLTISSWCLITDHPLRARREPRGLDRLDYGPRFMSSIGAFCGLPL